MIKSKNCESFVQTSSNSLKMENGRNSKRRKIMLDFLSCDHFIFSSLFFPLMCFCIRCNIFCFWTHLGANWCKHIYDDLIFRIKKTCFSLLYFLFYLRAIACAHFLDPTAIFSVFFFHFLFSMQQVYATFPVNFFYMSFFMWVCDIYNY